MSYNLYILIYLETASHFIQVVFLYIDGRFYLSNYQHRLYFFVGFGAELRDDVTRLWFLEALSAV